MSVDGALGEGKWSLSKGDGGALGHRGVMAEGGGMVIFTHVAMFGCQKPNNLKFCTGWSDFRKLQQARESEKYVQLEKSV